MRAIRGGIRSENRVENRIKKIIEASDGKRNFIPLFARLEPCILGEEERKSLLFQATKKYFEVKDKIEEENQFSF